jgi:hypothetical protein
MKFTTQSDMAAAGHPTREGQCTGRESGVLTYASIKRTFEHLQAPPPPPSISASAIPQWETSCRPPRAHRCQTPHPRRFHISSSRRGLRLEPHYVAAVLVLLKAENEDLLNSVLLGDLPLLAAAAQARRVADLVSAYRHAQPEDLVALGRTVGPEMLFTRVIEPAI